MAREPGQPIGGSGGAGAGAGAGGAGAGRGGGGKTPAADALALAEENARQANAGMVAAQQQANMVAQQMLASQQAQQVAHNAELEKLKADMAAAQQAALQAAAQAAAGAGGGMQQQQNPYHNNAAWDPSKHVAPTALYGPNPEAATATSVADAGMALNTAINDQPQTIPREVERALIRLPLPEAKGRLAPYIRASVVSASVPEFCKGTVVVEIERFTPPTADVFQAHPISKGISVLSFVPGARILASLEAHGVLSDLFSLLRLLLGDFNQAVATPDVMKWFRGWTEHFILEWRKMTQLVNIIATYKEMPVGAPEPASQALKAAIRHSMTDAVGFATTQLVRATAFSMSNALKPKFSSWLTALSAYGATWSVDPILFGSFGYDGAAERWTHHVMSGLSRKITYQTLIEFLPAVTGTAPAPTGTAEQVTPVEVPSSSFWPSAQARRLVSPVISLTPPAAAHTSKVTSACDSAGTSSKHPRDSCLTSFARESFVQSLVELQKDRSNLVASPFSNADVSMLKKLVEEESLFRGTCTVCHLSHGKTSGELPFGLHTHVGCIKATRVQKLVLGELAGNGQYSKAQITELERASANRARNNFERNAQYREENPHRRSPPGSGAYGGRGPPMGRKPY